MSSGSGLPPKKHAAFAVMSRLISCLVTEGLLRAFFVAIPGSGAASGVLVVLSTHLLSEQPVLSRSIHGNDVFAIVPLHHPPVFADRKIAKYGLPVGLVDPLDMLPLIYELEHIADGTRRTDAFSEWILRSLRPPAWDFHDFRLRETVDPVVLWNNFVDGIVVQDLMRETIAKELASSFDHQYLAYKDPRSCPSLQSSPIEWEQSLIAGHPTHPMHRARMLPSSDLNFDWYRPVIRFVQVPKASLYLRGSFQEVSSFLVKKAAANSTIILDHGKYIFVPVHELQLPNVVRLFADVVVLPPEISLDALAQSSIRTVIVPELPGHALKLAVGVKISSSLRTISHFTANFGPRFSVDVVPRLAVDQNILAVELEPSSVVYHCDDPEVQKHFTAVIRKEYEPAPDENVIVCAALLETGHANTPLGVSAVEHVFGLDTERKRIEFLDRYIELSCRALLPALIRNGVAFEAHAQNVLVRINRNSGEILGFVIRDLGGLRIHPPTLCESIGLNFEFLPQHCIATETLEEIYPKFYHTYVHNHIQRLIRLLNLHYNGVGWELLRRHMSAVIPPDHGLRTLWLSRESKTVQSKCLLRMRMRDSYRDMVYSPYPNMIQFRPGEIDGRTRRESML